MDNFSKDKYLKELLGNASGNAIDTVMHDLRNRANSLVMTSSFENAVLRNELEGSDAIKILDSIEALAQDISNIVEAYMEYAEMKRK